MADKSARRDAMVFEKKLAGDNDGKLVADERGSRLLILSTATQIYQEVFPVCYSAYLRSVNPRLTSKHAVVE